jgi:hypothetical protein
VNVLGQRTHVKLGDHKITADAAASVVDLAGHRLSSAREQCQVRRVWDPSGGSRPVQDGQLAAPSVNGLDHVHSIRQIRMLSAGGSRSRCVTERHPDAVARVEFRLLDQRSLPVNPEYLVADVNFERSKQTNVHRKPLTTLWLAVPPAQSQEITRLLPMAAAGHHRSSYAPQVGTSAPHESSHCVERHR